MTGATLSHYKILSELGRGGMGVVYKAEDTSLDRTVALKVLPSASLAGEDDRARFYREAKAAAQLHHPHIATVFQIDEAVPSDAPHGTQPSPFIAMEFIDGVTLEARVKKGPMKLSDAVRIASEIAEALKAAHAKGIVHRDIKSGNAMLDANGVAKVLDFGLAKTSQSTKLTKMGSTLGTVSYMSPEQARGEELDSRSDLWSLGVVLYEMISGRTPFSTEYEQAAIYSILNEDPEPLTAVRTGVPMDLERIVNKCLMKDRARRYQHADDLIADLKGVVIEPSSTVQRTVVRSAIASPEPTSRRAGPKMAVIAVLTFLAGMAVAWIFLRGSSTDSPSIFGAIPVVDPSGEALSIPNADRRSIDISPDGSKVVFIGGDGLESKLYLRSFDSDQTTVIPGTVFPGSPTFSPDGTEIAYCADQSIMRVPTGGGRPTEFASVPVDYSCAGLAWLSDGSLIFVPSRTTGLWHVSKDGSDVRQLTFPDADNGDISHRWPRALPDHSGVTFVIKTNSMESLEEARVALYDVASDVTKILFEGGTDAQVTEDGYLLYVKEAGLFAVVYDASAKEVRGEHARILSSVGMRPFSGEGDYAVSGENRFVFLKDRIPISTPVEIVRQGVVDRVFALPDIANVMALSPDGRFAALEMPAANNYVSLLELETGSVTRLTFRFNSRWPLWTPDGKWITFLSDRSGKNELNRIPLEGGEALEVTPFPFVDLSPTDWSSDGKTLVYTASSPGTLSDVWRARQEDGEWRHEPILNGPYNEYGGTLSSDGSMLAYVSDETGDGEVFVVRYPQLTGKRKVSQGGGELPRWKPNSNSVFYLTADQLMEADVASGSDGISVSSPRPFGVLTSDFDYQILPDGSGYIRLRDVVTGYDAENPDQIWFMTDFSDILQRAF